MAAATGSTNDSLPTFPLEFLETCLSSMCYLFQNLTLTLFIYFLTFCSRRRIFFHAIMTAVPTDGLSRKIYTKASCWDNFEGCCWYFWPWTEDVLLIAIDPNPFYVFLSYEIVIYLQFKARNKYQQPSKWSQRSLCL